MKNSKNTQKMTQMVKNTALKALTGKADEGPVGNIKWPWCGGIVYQPKHPLLMQQEELLEKNK